MKAYLAINLSSTLVIYLFWSYLTFDLTDMYYTIMESLLTDISSRTNLLGCMFVKTAMDSGMTLMYKQELKTK
jgi:hypothetical protein